MWAWSYENSTMSSVSHGMARASCYGVEQITDVDDLLKTFIAVGDGSPFHRYSPFSSIRDRSDPS